MKRLMLVPTALAMLAAPALAQDAPPGSWAELPGGDAGDSHGIAGVNGSIYRFGGNTGTAGLAITRAFSLASSEWTVKANIPEGARRFSTVAIGENIYLVGVANGSASYIYRYATSTDSWSNVGTMDVPCWAVASAVWHDKIILVGGILLARGNDVGSFTGERTVQLFDPANGQFSRLPDLPRGQGVAMAMAGVLNDRVTVAGGVRSIFMGPAVPDVLMLDPGHDHAWQTCTPMPEMRFGSASFTLNDRLYVAGGGTWDAGSITWSGYVSTTYEFDPWANLWTERSPLPGPARGWPAGCSLDGKAYVHGGAPRGLPVSSLFETYTPGPANVSINHLVQLREDGEPLALGTVLEPRSTVILGATVTDTVAGNRSEVEFDVLSGTGRLSMRTGRAPNGESRMLVPGSAGVWKWRARAVSEFGHTGPWVAFSGGEFKAQDSEEDADFTILAPPPPPPVAGEVGGEKAKGCPLAAGGVSIAWILLPLLALGLRRN